MSLRYGMLYLSINIMISFGNASIKIYAPFRVGAVRGRNEYTLFKVHQCYCVPFLLAAWLPWKSWWNLIRLCFCVVHYCHVLKKLHHLQRPQLVHMSCMCGLFPGFCGFKATSLQEYCCFVSIGCWNLLNTGVHPGVFLLGDEIRWKVDINLRNSTIFKVIYRFCPLVIQHWTTYYWISK